MPTERSDRFLSRPAIVVIGAIVALVAIAVVAERTNLGGLRVTTKPTSSAPSSSTTTTVPPPTPGELAANARFADAGKAPISVAERGVVDLAGTRDVTAPGLSIPTVECSGRQATVRVTASDDTQVASVIGSYTRTDGTRSALPFRSDRGAWSADAMTAPGVPDAVSVVATDASGNTLTRTLTNLCA